MAKKTSQKSAVAVVGAVKESGLIQKDNGGTQKDGESEHSQGFSFRAPEAVSVQLVGDFTHWQEKPISLKKEAGGVWRTSVQLTPGEHHYRFLVDGEWRDDPECPMRVPNPFGSQDMMRKVA